MANATYADLATVTTLLSSHLAAVWDPAGPGPLKSITIGQMTTSYFNPLFMRLDAASPFSTSADIFADGAQSTPGIAFDNETSMGLYRVSSGILGISTAGIERIRLSSAGITLQTDLALTEGGTGASTAAGARTNLGLGTAAVVDTGTSGATVPLLNGANTWSGVQTWTTTGHFSGNAAGGGVNALGLQNLGGGAGAFVTLDLAPNASGFGIRSSQIVVITDLAGNGTSMLLRTNPNGAPAANGIIIDSAQAIRFPAYGAGALSTDASGNITASSDAALKDVTGKFTRGLADLLNMGAPVSFRWKRELEGIAEARERVQTMPDKCGPEDFRVAALDNPTYAGFTAQDVQMGIPEAVSPSADGTLCLQTLPLIAALVNAVRELDARLRALEA